MMKKKKDEDESKNFYKLSVTFYDQKPPKDEKAKAGKFSFNFLCSFFPFFSFILFRSALDLGE